MENIDKSLIVAMLENQCRILAELQSLKRRFDSEYIMRHHGNFDVIDQLNATESNIEADTKQFIQETFDRAEKIEQKLSRDNNYYQEL